MATPQSKRPLLVYVAAPYRIPDPVRNTRIAAQAGMVLNELGYVAVVPHLSLAWDLICHRPPEYWLKYDLMLLERCDAMVRLPGVSQGADQEEQYALQLGIPVYYSLESFHCANSRKAVEWSPV